MQQHTIPSSTRTERLVEILRLDIIKGVLPGGTRLTEEGLAERYGVSRTPVREALRVLALESLLDYTPRSGYVVEAIDLDEMDDLYAIRIAIEEQSAARLAGSHGNDSVLNNLLEYWGEMPAAVASGDLNLVYADETFHESLAQASHSSVLPPMLQTINRRLHVLRVRDFMDPERVRLTFDQHAAILESLLKGDARLAQAMLRAHILESHAFVRARFLQDLGDADD
ncbi:MAG TPA: GntR family transcriptional regulator [Dehalococcoidia bacterium]|nr:GntR family transcriptional regulator [Dehalococcoidia bacterium]